MNTDQIFSPAEAIEKFIITVFKLYHAKDKDKISILSKQLDKISPKIDKILLSPGISRNISDYVYYQISKSPLKQSSAFSSIVKAVGGIADPIVLLIVVNMDLWAAEDVSHSEVLKYNDVLANEQLAAVTRNINRLNLERCKAKNLLNKVLGFGEEEVKLYK